MQSEDRVRFAHMIEAAEAALRFLEGRTRRDLDADEMLRFAVVRAVEIFGEAATRISEPARAATPEIPWRLIVAMRNRLVHAYFDVNRDVLWNTVREEIPQVLPALRKAVGQQ